MWIIAPAGNRERYDAAIKGGADEIYMGIKGYGARRNADNFSISEYIEALNYAHLRGVKILLTLNTVMKDIEIESLYENLKKLYENGLDAVIVQDLGLGRFIRENFPGLEIHGSTQLSVTTSVEANYLKSQGFKRVVLSRELTFSEIKKVREETDIELEIFVSGALCVAYSGKCYLSSFIGGRSGNRGLCTQLCRKEYSGSKKDGYLLSPRDQLLMKKEYDLLSEIGVDAIKVEGRMKSKEYVYETVAHYKGLKEGDERESRSHYLFNRGYSKGYFYGDKDLINERYSAHLGVKVGEIQRDRKVVLEENIVNGDGVVCLDRDYKKLSGGYINKITLDREQVDKGEKGEEVEIRGVELPREGRYLYRNYSKEVVDSIEITVDKVKRRVGVVGKGVFKLGEKPILEVEFKSGKGEKLKVNLVGDKEIEEAKKRPSKREDIEEKIMESGDFPFFFEKLEVEVEGNIFIPVSIVKELRRSILKELEEKVIASYKRVVKGKKWTLPKDNSKRDNQEISAVVRDESMVEVVRNLGIKKVYVEEPMIYSDGPQKRPSRKLATSLYDGILAKEEITLWWTYNVINTYSLNEVSKINENVKTVILSPEIAKKNISKIGDIGVRKGYVIYGKLMGMYLKLHLGEEETIENKEGDRLEVEVNKYGNTEIRLEKPMNLIPKLDEISNLPLDELVLYFTNESEREIKEIVSTLHKREGEYNPYNYERGIY